VLVGRRVTPSEPPHSTWAEIDAAFSNLIGGGPGLLGGAQAIEASANSSTDAAQTAISRAIERFH
jgi:hypothetical protein